MSLPQLTADLFITDGGLETTLVFQDGIDLPDFAAFPLLDSDAGMASLAAYYAPYLDLAQRLDVGIVLDTPTWRANPDWAARLGYDEARLIDVNRRSVAFVESLAADRPTLTAVVNGVVGPRGDGYVVGATMSAAEAAGYHGLQARAFADAGVAMMSAVTMTYADEAIGVVQAATTVGLPVVVSFTVETDGRLPSGQSLAAAIAEVDAATDGAAAYFMINCAHPTHFTPVLGAGESWLMRVKAVRANASRMSHAELDAATELDRGDPADFGRRHAEVAAALPDLRVVGGCCGTDHQHVAAAAAALTGERDDQ